MRSHQKFLQKTAVTTAAVLLLSAPALAADFTDEASITHGEAVSELVGMGIIDGRPDGSFDPGGTFTRAEMAKILSALVDPEAEGASSAGFRDVSGSWAEPYINHCYSLGLISGRGSGVFDPDGAVTGTETAKMLLSLAGYDAAGFTGGGWDQRVNETAKAAGLYMGLTADPALVLTRDDAALLLCNGIELIDGSVMNLSGAPTGIAVMPDGSFLVTDAFTRTVSRLNGQAVSTYAGAVTAADVNGRPLGGYYDSSAAKSTFKSPWAAAPFLDGWAVSDAENNVIRLIQNGQVMTVNPGGGEGEQQIFAYPTGLAAGADGSLYAADTHNGRVCRIDPDGTMTIAANGLQDPMGLCWHNGVLYIAETGANRIVQLKDGKVSTVAGSGEDGYADGSAAGAQFSGPKGVAVDAEGAIYVSDTGNSAVRCIKNGRVTTMAICDLADEELSFPVSPMGLAWQGRWLYVCDSFTGALMKIMVR